MIMDWLKVNKTGIHSAKEIVEGIQLGREDLGLRTLQRDLLLLVKTGKLDRTGTTTRPRYSLAREQASGASSPQDEFLLLTFLARLRTMVGPTAKSLDKVSAAIDGLIGTAEDFRVEVEDRISNDVFVMGGKAPDTLTGVDLARLLTGFVTRKKIEVLYQLSDGSCSKLVLAPSKLIINGGDLYFACLPNKNGDTSKYYKLSRILRARVLDETFSESPEDKRKLEERLLTNFGILDNDGDVTEDVVLRFDAAKVQLLRERVYHRTQTTRLKGRYAYLHMTVPIGRELLNWCLLWHDIMTVMQPRELKIMLEKTGRMLARKYRIV